MERLDDLLDLLLTVGHIDGLFHAHEQAFGRQYIDSLARHAALAEAPTGSRSAR